MSKLSELFKSKHKTKLPDPEEPTPFQMYGGFGPAAEAAGVRLDDDESERSARREGLSVEAQLERERLERQREARKADPLPSGNDYSKGLG